MNLLIIGGSGFFGKSFLDSFSKGQLQKFGINNITILARSASSLNVQCPELLNSNIQLLNGNIETLNELPKADFVIHAATSTQSSEYLSSEKQNNPIENTVENYCKRAPFFHANSRVVYCSSGAVYGQQSSEIDKIPENAALQDVNPLQEYKKLYALRKRNSEKSIQKLGQLGLNVAIARCFSFYGKYLPKDQHYAYGNFLASAEKKETIQVTAKNLVYRSYMHADDLVYSLMNIARIASPECPIFNVGSDEAIEIRDLARKIAKEYNVTVNLTEPNTLLAPDKYIPNIDRLKKLNIHFSHL